MKGMVFTELMDMVEATFGSEVLENMIDGPTKQYATRVLNDYAAYKRIYYEATEDDA